MELGPHQKVFVVSASLQDGEVVATERTLAGGPDTDVRPAHPSVVVTRHAAAFRFKETVGAMLRTTAKLLVLSPVLLIVAPIASKIYQPAPAYVLAMFVCVVVLFFATFDLFIAASIVAWVRRKRSGRPAFVLPAWNGDAKAPSLAREALGETVRCVGRAVCLTTGRDPILNAAWWTGDDPTELILCSTFAVVPKSGPAVIVRHVRAPRVFPERSQGGVNVELLELANAHIPSHIAAKPFDDELVIREGDEVEVEGTAIEIVDNSSHFQIDGVVTGLPATNESDEDPYRAAPGEPALIVEAPVIRRIS